MKEDFLWVEKYRPKTINECILPESIKSKFRECVETKNIPNMILFGTSGVGKTTASIAMCEESGTSFIKINGSLENGIDLLRTKIQSFGSSVSLYGGRKVIIVDEADNLTSDAQKAFRGVIESFSNHCSFIFTCNYLEKIIPALHSRNPPIDFRIKKEERVEMAKLFFARIKYILEKENVQFSPNVVIKVITKFFPDYRRIIGELQQYSISNKIIDDGILSLVTDLDIKVLVDNLKIKNFKEIRKWVAQNSSNDSTLIRKIYDSLSDFLKPESVPTAILLLSKYQNQAKEVNDQEINLMAMMIEIMIECQVK